MKRGKVLEFWRQKLESGARVKGGPSGPDYVLVTNADKLEVKSAALLASLLPIGDANGLSLAATKDRARGPLPVITGVCATDPLRMMENFLQEVKAAGAAGVQNYPSVGLIDGSFRRILEETRLGFGREVEMIRMAGSLDLLTLGLAFSPEDAKGLAEAGADVVVAHPGLVPEKDHAKRVAEVAAGARSGREGILVFGVGVEGKGLDGIQSE